MGSNGLPPERKSIDAMSPPPPRSQSRSEQKPVRIGDNPALDMLFGLEFLRSSFGSTCNDKSEVTGE